MPELPEVETIRRQMEAALLGQTVSSVDVLFAGRLFQQEVGQTKAKKMPPAQFIQRFTGAKCIAFKRRAKLLIVEWDSGYSLLAHLKMTGKFLLKPASEKPSKHTQVVFHLSQNASVQDKFVLWFEDIRKFGFLKVVPTADVQALLSGKDGYGPEPLSEEFTLEIMKNCLSRHPGKKIKPLLMDQTCIAGIGNIYADEALWHARVRPMRTAKTLKKKELQDLHTGIKESLTESLKHRGASSDNYRDLNGEPGESVQFLHAYGKSHCPRCQGTMVKVYIAQRVAHYCPRCQK